MIEPERTTPIQRPDWLWSSARARLQGALVLLAALSLSAVAHARRNGIASSTCDGCHGATGEAEIRGSADPAMFSPGSEVTFTATVISPGSQVAGIFIATSGPGTLSAVDGDLRALTGGLAHTAPKNANAAGETSFRFRWRAPDTPGAVRFDVVALAGNGDGRSSGDTATSDVLSFTYGCTGATFYPDLDRDGFGGHIAPAIQNCAGEPPDGYSARADDCDDSYEKVNPLATEICNKLDDDCDGEVDEGAPPIQLWPDSDGDGYYASQTGTPVMGCVGLKGYAAQSGDCAPSDPARHLGATEVCNLFDDNCDGRVDERLRPQCGVGLCRRESPTCDAKDCREGAPATEVCNLFDDDCDDLIDDDAACPVGKTCIDGACVDGNAASSGAGGSAPSTPAGGVSGGVMGGRAQGGAAGQVSSPSGATAGAMNPAGGTAPQTPSGGASSADSQPGGGCAVASRASALGPWLSFAALLGVARIRRRQRAPMPKQRT